MNVKKRAAPVFCALLAAVFYAVNTPFSKLLLDEVPAAFMAAFLYLGAGVGVGILYLIHGRRAGISSRLTQKELPYTVGMIVLDIAAPFFLMLGIQYGTASSASLLGNFEIAATTIIAFWCFKEPVSRRLWMAIGLIMVSSMILSFEGSDSLRLSAGSLFVILAAVCWGLENNCTRNISDKSTYQIVMLKGFFSGGGSFLLALLLKEKVPGLHGILLAMLLGFVSYGLSIFLYIRAQRNLGAAKTSAYYAAAPFVGALLSFLILGEPLTGIYFAALVFMLAGTVLVVRDTMERHHMHAHIHTITHTHDGTTHTHKIEHVHDHSHYGIRERHGHHHDWEKLTREEIHTCETEMSGHRL